MIAWLAVAALVATRVPLMLIAIVVAAIVHPFLFLAGVALWAARHRRRLRRVPSAAAAEAALLRGMSSELERGASLRGAVVEAGSGVQSLGVATRAAAAGRPVDEVARELHRALPVNGATVAAAYEMASEAGGPVSGLFRRLADRAEEVADADRERRAATVQARLSSLVVSLTPVGVLLLLGATRRLEGLFNSGSIGFVILAVGGGLVLAGAVAAAAVTRVAFR